jgi:hypothetical protein
LRVQGAAIKGQAGIGLLFILPLYKVNQLFFTLIFAKAALARPRRMI